MNQALHVDDLPPAGSSGGAASSAGNAARTERNNASPTATPTNGNDTMATHSPSPEADISHPKINRAPRALMVIEKKEHSPFDAAAHAKHDVRLGQWDVKFAVSLVMLVIFINLSLTLLFGNSVKHPGAAPQEDLSFQGQFGETPESTAEEQGSQIYLPPHNAEEEPTGTAGDQPLDENIAPAAGEQSTQKLLSIINRY